MYEFALSNARLIDPDADLDENGAVAFADGKIAAVGSDVDLGAAKSVKDVAGRIVCPGLIDLHTHVYWGGTSLGVDPVAYAAVAGTTTIVDAGSSGPGNFAGFRAHVIEPACPNIYVFLNISFAGIYGFSEDLMVGECADLRLLNPYACLRVAESNRDLIVGVKVRVGMTASESNGTAPLDIALEVAEELDLPVMCHLDNPPPTRSEVVRRLRPGDILTHCFRPFPSAPARARDGHIYEEILEARSRGVLFDIGHGAGSFGFVSAEAMLAGGFQPDSISSDVHTLSINGPAHSQLVTMSKFLALGMTPNDVIRAATVGPANAMGKPELGTLALGSPGDVTVLDLEHGEFEFVDVNGLSRTNSVRFALESMVIAGRIWPK